MDRFLMDNHKLLWHLDRVNSWVKIKRIVPLHIDLGITTGCNMKCVYCYGKLQGNVDPSKRFDMPKEAIICLLTEAKEMDVKSIAFVGEGENTLNKNLGAALEYAKCIDLDVSLATNGILLREDEALRILSSLTWIRFNISAATHEVYWEVHGGGFESVIRNIKKCVELKRKYELGVTIGLQMVVVENNIHEIVPLAQMGKELGVDYLVVKPCSDTYDKALKAPYGQYILPRTQDVLAEAERVSCENYDVVVKWDKMGNLGKKNYSRCNATEFIIAISGNGNVFPCGHFFKSPRFLMGNIIDTSLKEVVASDQYWAVQELVKTLDVNRVCESNCRQHYVNQFLWDLLNPPKHVNFI